MGIREIPGLGYEPGSALMDPKRPNFTVPGGARQPYDFDTTVRDVSPVKPATPMATEVPTNSAGYRAGNAVGRGVRAMVGNADDWKAYGAKVGDGASKLVGDTGKLRSFADSKMLPALGTLAKKVAPYAGVAEAVQGAREGDGGKIALGTVDTVAGLGLGTPAAPLAGAWLGGRAVAAGLHGAYNAGQNLDQGLRERIGGTMATMFGQDGMVDKVNEANAFLNQGRVSPRTAVARYSGTSTAGAGRGSVNPPLAGSIRDDGVTPQLPDARGSVAGTGVEGAPGVRKFQTADGRTLYSNVAGDNSAMMGKGGTVSVVPTEDSAMARMQRASDIYKEMGSLRDGPNLPALQGAYIPGVNAPETQDQRETRERNASVQSIFTTGSPRRAQQERIAAADRANLRDIASMRDATERRGQTMTDAGFARRDEVTKRGQDLDYDAATSRTAATTAVARANAQRAAMESDRNYNLEVQKYGASEAKARFDRRAEATTNFTKEVEAFLPNIPGPDGKPMKDTEGIARVMTGVTARLGEVQADLERRAATGDRKAIDMLKKADAAGGMIGALDTKDRARLLASFQMTQAAEADAGGRFNPFSSTVVKSNAPITGLRETEPGWLGTNIGREYQTDRGDTIRGSVVHGGYFTNNDKRFKDLIER